MTPQTGLSTQPFASHHPIPFPINMLGPADGIRLRETLGAQHIDAHTVAFAPAPLPTGGSTPRTPVAPLPGDDHPRRRATNQIKPITQPHRPPHLPRQLRLQRLQERNADRPPHATAIERQHAGGAGCVSGHGWRRLLGGVGGGQRCVIH